MSTTSAETVDQTPQALLNVNMFNITKLTSSNYMMWSLQVHALLDGYDLAGHLDGTTPPPDPTVTENTVTSPNPAYTLWKRQDKLIYSGLIGAITMPIQPIVSKTKTATEIWTTLAATYAKPSRGHVQQLKLQLRQWSKGTKTIDEYVQGFTTRFDQLALLGKPVDHEDQIEYILGGLPEEYKQTIDQLEARDVSPSVIEVHEKLLNKEAKILAVSSVSPVVPITANAASTQPQGRNNNSGRNNQQWNRNPQPSRHNNNNYRDNRNNRGQQGGYQGRCQICGIQGHSARRCPRLGNQSAMATNNQVNNYTPWQPQAHMAMLPPSSSSSWIMDSGATHHLTSDLDNLSLHQPYSGNDRVLIGDGSGLPITHSGSLSLSLPSRNLALTDVLCVPHIHKNLISVYRLCNANKVSVEFFPASFQVKDLSSGVLDTEEE